MHIIEHDGKRFSVFPPGWPLLLSLFVKIKFPLYLVNPILGSILLALVYTFGEKLYSKKIALLTCATMLVSPLFLFNSSSYFSHTFCACLLFSLLILLEKYKNSPSKISSILIGFFSVFFLITRYHTAFFCGLIIIFHPAIKKLLKNKKHLLFCFIGALPILIFLFCYNFSISKNPFFLPSFYSEYLQNDIFQFDFLKDPQYFIALPIKNFARWTPVAILPFYLVFTFVKIKNPNSSFELIPLSVIIGYFFLLGFAGNMYGNRFYFEVYPLMLLSVFQNINDLKRKNLFNSVLYLSILISGASAFYFAKVEHEVIVERTDMFYQVKANKISDAVILISNNIGTKRPMHFLDLTRNDPDFNNSVLYALNGGKLNEKLFNYYPNRKFYKYRYFPEINAGKLSRIK